MHNKSLILTLGFLGFLALLEPSAYSQNKTAAEANSPDCSIAEKSQGARDNCAKTAVIDEQRLRSDRDGKTVNLPKADARLKKNRETAKSKGRKLSARENATSRKSDSESREAPRDTNFFQLKPTILDERYIRSGRAERTLKLPGVLPPEAPIPADTSGRLSRP